MTKYITHKFRKGSYAYRGFTIKNESDGSVKFWTIYGQDGYETTEVSLKESKRLIDGWYELGIIE